jgi:hypothetical protein
LIAGGYGIYIWAFPGAYKIGRDHVVPVVDLDAFVDAQAAAARALRVARKIEAMAIDCRRLRHTFVAV